MLRLLAVFLLLLAALTGGAGSAQAQAVTRVLDGKSFLLASGQTVLLASLEVPAGDPSAGPSQAPKAALERLLTGHGVRIDEVVPGYDRHDRIVGQVTREDGAWVQGEMLRAGWAMVRSFPGDAPALTARMLAAEAEAQAARRGLWADPDYRVLKPEETPAFIGQFRLVEGKVASAHPYHGNLYLNFSERWKGNFAAFIGRKYLPAFAALHPEALGGKTIRVRGWIDRYGGAPSIDLTHPAQIELR